jgi:hypothetical protein
MKKLLVTFMVVLSATLVHGQTKTELKLAGIPKTAKVYVMENMSNCTVDTAFKVENNGGITYKVILMKGAQKTTLTFDKNGSFLKKEVKPAGENKPVRVF